jgi:hypothetical protein
MLASGQSGIQLDLIPLQVADLGSGVGGIIDAMAVSFTGAGSLRKDTTHKRILRTKTCLYFRRCHRRFRRLQTKPVEKDASGLAVAYV